MARDDLGGFWPKVAVTGRGLKLERPPLRQMKRRAGGEEAGVPFSVFRQQTIITNFDHRGPLEYGEIEPDCQLPGERAERSSLGEACRRRVSPIDWTERIFP